MRIVVERIKGSKLEPKVLLLLTYIQQFKQQLSEQQGSFGKRLGGTILTTLGFLLSAWTGATSIFLSPTISASVATVSIYCRTEDISLTQLFGHLFGKLKQTIHTPRISVESLDEMVGATEMSDAKRLKWDIVLKYVILGGFAVYSFISGLIRVPQMSQVMVDTTKKLAQSTANEGVILDTAVSYSSSNLLSDNIGTFLVPITAIGVLLTSGFSFLSLSQRLLREYLPSKKDLNKYKECRMFIIEFLENVKQNLVNFGWDRKTSYKDFILPIEGQTVKWSKSYRFALSINTFFSSQFRSELMWYGFTYRLEYVPDGSTVVFYKIGYSTESNFRRFEAYMRKACLVSRLESLKFKRPIQRLGITLTIEYLMREHLEKIAQDAGTSYWDYFTYSDPNTPNIIKFNFELARQELEKTFRFVPTAVFWDKEMMKESEKRQIEQGWNEGLALNFQKGGEGPERLLLDYIDWILVYIGMGDSKRVIATKLKAQIPDREARRRITPDAINLVLEDVFGSIEAARHLITDRIIDNLEKRLSAETIWRFYGDYYVRTSKRNEISFDYDKFIGLARKGYTYLQMEPYLKMSRTKITKSVKDILQTRFSHLSRVFDIDGEDIGYLHLKWYLVAPIALRYLTEDKLSLDETAGRFGPRGVSKYFVSFALKKVYKLDYEGISTAYRLEQIKTILINNYFDKGSRFEESILKNVGIPKAYNYYYYYVTRRILKNRPDVYYTHFELYKIAILGPLIQSLFQKTSDINSVFESIKHFRYISEFIEWVKKAFKCNDIEKLIRLFQINYFSEEWFMRNYGLHIVPLRGGHPLTLNLL